MVKKTTTPKRERATREGDLEKDNSIEVMKEDRGERC